MDQRLLHYRRPELQEQTDSGSNCGDRGIHFSCPETVVSSGSGTRARARVVGQSVASPRRTVAARFGERAREAAVRSSGRLSAAPQVGGHCCRTQEGTRRFAAESGGAPRCVDGERTPRCGPSATHSISRAAHLRLVEFQKLRASKCFGEVRRSQDSLQVVLSACRRMRKVGSSWHHRVYGHQFKIRFDGCFDHRVVLS